MARPHTRILAFALCGGEKEGSMDFKDLFEFVTGARSRSEMDKNVARLTIPPSMHQTDVGWVGFFKGYKFWINSDDRLLIRSITDEELGAEETHTLAPRPPHNGQDRLFPPFSQPE